MSPALKIVSLVALVATIVPSVLYMSGALTHDIVKWIALAGTIVWFVATPLWMGRPTTVADDQVQI